MIFGELGVGLEQKSEEKTEEIRHNTGLHKTIQEVPEYHSPVLAE